MAHLCVSPSGAIYLQRPNVIQIGNEAGLGSQSSTNVASFSVQLPVNAGSRIHVVINYANDSNSMSVADGTNTYTGVGSTITGTYVCQQWVVNAAVAAGTYTIVGTFGGFSDHQWIIVAREIQWTTGLDSTGTGTPAGQTQTNPGTGANAVTTGNFTPSAAPGLMSAVSFQIGTPNLLSAGTGFTPGNAGTSTNTGSWLAESIRYTSTSVIAGTFTDGAGSAVFNTVAALFEEFPAGVPLAWAA